MNLESQVHRLAASYFESQIRLWLVISVIVLFFLIGVGLISGHGVPIHFFVPTLDQLLIAFLSGVSLGIYSHYRAKHHANEYADLHGVFAGKMAFSFFHSWGQSLEMHRITWKHRWLLRTDFAVWILCCAPLLLGGLPKALSPLIVLCLVRWFMWRLLVLRETYLGQA
jgi:hypothetical protein